MYRIMHNALTGNGAATWAALEVALEQDPYIERRTTLIYNSIYKYVNPLLGFSLAVAPLGRLLTLIITL